MSRSESDSEHSSAALSDSESDREETTKMQTSEDEEHSESEQEKSEKSEESSAAESESESGSGEDEDASESGSESDASRSDKNDGASKANGKAESAEDLEKKRKRREKGAQVRAERRELRLELDAVAAEAANKGQTLTSKLINKHIKALPVDHYYHLGLSTALPLRTMFGDVRFVILSGSPVRALETCTKVIEALNIQLPFGCAISPIGKTERYSLYKAGPVMSVSHGMGKPSIGIILHELAKLLTEAGVIDRVTFIRVGTSGGLGVTPGTVVVSSSTVNGAMEPTFPVISLGKTTQMPCKIQPELVDALLKVPARKDTRVIKGITMSTDEFYLGQGRIDGAYCDYNQEDKMRWIRKIHAAGVRNIEMEGDAIVAFCTRLNIKCAVVCCTIVDRLQGDQVTSTPAQLAAFTDNAVSHVIRYIQSQLGISIRKPKHAHKSMKSRRRALSHSMHASHTAVAAVAGTGEDFPEERVRNEHTGITGPAAVEKNGDGNMETPVKQKGPAQPPKKQRQPSQPGTPATSQKKKGEQKAPTTPAAASTPKKHDNNHTPSKANGTPSVKKPQQQEKKSQNSNGSEKKKSDPTETPKKQQEKKPESNGTEKKRKDQPQSNGSEKKEKKPKTDAPAAVPTEGKNGAQPKSEKKKETKEQKEAKKSPSTPVKSSSSTPSAGSSATPSAVSGEKPLNRRQKKKAAEDEAAAKAQKAQEEAAAAAREAQKQAEKQAELKKFDPDAALEALTKVHRPTKNERKALKEAAIAAAKAAGAPAPTSAQVAATHATPSKPTAPATEQKKRKREDEPKATNGKAPSAASERKPKKSKAKNDDDMSD